MVTLNKKIEIIIIFQTYYIKNKKKKQLNFFNEKSRQLIYNYILIAIYIYIYARIKKETVNLNHDDHFILDYIC